MKIDEAFKPSVKSTTPPTHLLFRLAESRDREPIASLMAERNPNQNFSDVLARTDREIALLSTDPDYRLFVAEVEAKIVGLCRYYHSSGLPPAKIKYPSPEGWYGMGILVDKNWRRRGIARFLFNNRTLEMKKHGAKELYSIVDAVNLTSIQMHLEFGFTELIRAPGFLHIELESGCGILFRKSLEG